MSKILKNFKKWISGVTVAALAISILPAQVAFAGVANITVDSLSTPDNSPIVSGTASEAGSVTVSVVGHPDVPAVSVLGSDGVYYWTAALGSAAPLVPDTYIVNAALDTDGDTVADYESSGELVVLPLTVGSMDLQVVKNTDPAVPLAGNFEDGYVLEVDGNPATGYIITSSEIKTNEAILSTAPGPGYELMMSSPSHPLSHFGFLSSNGTWDGLTTIAGASMFGPVWSGNQEEGVYTVSTVVKDSDGLNVDFEFELTFNNPATPAISLTQDVLPTLITDGSQVPEVILNTDVPGSVNYEGGCSGNVTQVVAGDNTIQLSSDKDGNYSGCKIVVEDKAGDVAKVAVGEYVVDKVGPTVDAGPDMLINKKTKINAISENAGTGISGYEWSQVNGPGAVTFSDAAVQNPYVTADIEGVYELQLKVTDSTGLLRTAKDTMKLTWDSQVSDVKNLSVSVDLGVAELSWDPTSDTDIDRIVVYRSEEKGVRGEVLVMLTPHAVSYEDTGLLAGVDYYYTVVRVDSAGNESDGVTVIGAWEEKVVSAAPVASVVSADDDQVKEIKSGITDDMGEGSEEGATETEVPMFGIVVLVLLIVLGVYLLYLQNPELFRKMVFWKQNKN